MRKLSTETRLQNRVRDLERRLDATHPALAVMPLEFLDALAALGHLALNGGHPNRRGYDQNGGHTPPQSTGTRDHNGAYLQLRTEQRHMLTRAATINTACRRFDPNDDENEKG